jgi:hypothetical protein
MDMTHGKPLHYQSYLLRCWAEREARSGRLVWRFSLEDNLTRQQRGFAGLEELVAALQSELTRDRRDMSTA